MDYETMIQELNLTKVEKEWLTTVKNHHSYFLMELGIDNKVKRVYLMDASGAPELTDKDKETYNFERRLDDEGVKKVKLNKRAYMNFWNKHVTMSLSGLSAVEYVHHRRYHKVYKCRPFGWIIDEFKG